MGCCCCSVQDSQESLSGYAAASVHLKGTADRQQVHVSSFVKVQSRWDDTKAERCSTVHCARCTHGSSSGSNSCARRYAYGTDACVKFSGVRLAYSHVLFSTVACRSGPLGCLLFRCAKRRGEANGVESAGVEGRPAQGWAAGPCAAVRQSASARLFA